MSDLTVSVEGGPEFHLGYSRLASYIQCPRQYKLTYIEGRRIEKPSATLRRGTAYHNSLEVARNFKMEKDRLLSLPKMQEVARYFAEQEALPESECTNVGIAVSHWWKEMYPQADPIAAEIPFEIIRSGVKITGRIDDVERTGWVIDDKFSYDTWAEDRAAYNLQAVIYQWAAEDQLEGQLRMRYKGFAWHITRIYPTCITQVIGVKRLSPEVSQWWENMFVEVAHGIQSGIFHPTPGKKVCGFCQHKDVCSPPRHKLAIERFGLPDAIEEDCW